MKNLHLNLYKKWFDMTKDGIKTEDYREIKPHWIRYLMLYENKVIDKKLSILIYNHFDCKLYFPGVVGISFKNYDTCTISNGFAIKRPQFIIENKSIEIGTGKKEWGYKGGELEIPVFIIKHGQIL